jgi:hypothetical protein
VSITSPDTSGLVSFLFPNFFSGSISVVANGFYRLAGTPVPVSGMWQSFWSAVRRPMPGDLALESLALSF